MDEGSVSNREANSEINDDAQIPATQSGERDVKNTVKDDMKTKSQEDLIKPKRPSGYDIFPVDVIEST